MQLQRVIWLTAIAVVASCVVSVATVCVVVPMVVDGEPTNAASDVDTSPTKDPFRTTAEPPPSSPLDDVEDAEAIASIKSNLGIDFYSGTLLDAPASARGNVPAERPAEIAAAALADSAERLEAEGNSEAARLVRQAAKHLPVSTARAAQDTPTPQR